MAFDVYDKHTAGRAMQEIAEHKKAIEEAKYYARKERERINHWLEEETRRPLAEIGRLEGLLTIYYQNLKEEDPKARLSTPWGKVTSRTTQSYDWGNDDALTLWLKEHGQDEYIREKTTYSPNKEEIRKRFQVAGNMLVSPSGEPVEGVTVEPKTTYRVVTE